MKCGDIRIRSWTHANPQGKGDSISHPFSRFVDMSICLFTGTWSIHAVVLDSTTLLASSYFSTRLVDISSATIIDGTWYQVMLLPTDYGSHGLKD